MSASLVAETPVRMLFIDRDAVLAAMALGDLLDEGVLARNRPGPLPGGGPCARLEAIAGAA